MWCFHDRLRELTFQDGTIIKMCPDCTAFDTKRIEVLRTGKINVPKAKQEELHWNMLLDEAGLNPDTGLKPWLSYMGNYSGSLDARYVGVWPTFVDAVDRLKMLFHSKRDRTIPTTLDDYEHVERQAYFAHSQAMPRRFTAYCPNCTDVVVDKLRRKVRTTHGVYLPIEHECASVRVYDLKGSLVEVKAI